MRKASVWNERDWFEWVAFVVGKDPSRTFVRNLSMFVLDSEVERKGIPHRCAPKTDNRPMSEGKHVEPPKLQNKRAETGAQG